MIKSSDGFSELKAIFVVLASAIIALIGFFIYDKLGSPVAFKVISQSAIGQIASNQKTVTGDDLTLTGVASKFGATLTVSKIVERPFYYVVYTSQNDITIIHGNPVCSESKSVTPSITIQLSQPITKSIHISSSVSQSCLV